MNANSPFSPEQWEQTPVEVQAYLRAREARVAAVDATVRDLTERLQQDARTSSRPPSSDPPPARAKRVRGAPSGRRPGGHPGHEGRSRVLLPVAEVAAVHAVKPTRCQSCQQRLHGQDSQPQRHQVTEIAPVIPVVTEYQLPRLLCPACGAATRAALPVGVPPGGFGPRLQAIAALCTGASHLSKRSTQSLLADLFGVPLGRGTISRLEQATVQAVAPAVAAARAYVQEQPGAPLEETGWREGRARAWLWTAVTAWGTVFVVRTSRGAKVAKDLLGQSFWGILVTDRWSAYTWYATKWRQVCWAHF